MTEIRVLDTYWSDRCRHTTFSTEFKRDSLLKMDIINHYLKEPFAEYQADTKADVYGDRKDKFICLMDLGGSWL